MINIRIDYKSIESVSKAIITIKSDDLSKDDLKELIEKIDLFLNKFMRNEKELQ